MKIENRQKFLFILTLVVLGLVVCNWVIFTPLGHWWTTRSQTIKNLRDNVKHGKSMLLNEAGIRSQWSGMLTNTLPNTLPNDQALAQHQVLNAFDSWAQESGASLTLVNSQWKNDSTNYLTLNCRVEATGDLGTLSRFVYDIEKGPLGLKLDSVEFSAHDNFGQQLTLGLQVSGLALTTK
jgi:Tfp pilus assembly protein PilO